MWPKSAGCSAAGSATFNGQPRHRAWLRAVPERRPASRRLGRAQQEQPEQPEQRRGFSGGCVSGLCALFRRSGIPTGRPPKHARSASAARFGSGVCRADTNDSPWTGSSATVQGGSATPPCSNPAGIHRSPARERQSHAREQRSAWCGNAPRRAGTIRVAWEQSAPCGNNPRRAGTIRAVRERSARCGNNPRGGIIVAHPVCSMSHRG
jgi:hypothetical protein